MTGNTSLAEPEDPVLALSKGFGALIGARTEDLAFGLNVARTHMQRGAHSEAMRIYAMLVLCDPRHPDFQIGLANCALAMGENALALQAASAVVALRPADPRGYFLSARACFGMGALAEAAEDLADAGLHARAANDRTMIEAVAQLDRLVKLDPARGLPS